MMTPEDTLMIIDNRLVELGLIESKQDREDRIGNPHLYTHRKQGEIAQLQAKIDLIKSRLPVLR